jgi:hypothetical protein
VTPEDILAVKILIGMTILLIIAGYAADDDGLSDGQKRD